VTNQEQPTLFDMAPWTQTETGFVTDASDVPPDSPLQRTRRASCKCRKGTVTFEERRDRDNDVARWVGWCSNPGCGVQWAIAND
jgi:hypothetical protein